MDIAHSAALVRLLPVEKERIAVRALIESTRNGRTELRQLEVARPVSGILRGTAPGITVLVDMTTPACSGCEANFRMVANAVLPSSRLSHARSFLFAFLPLVFAVHLVLFVLRRCSLLALNANVRPLITEALFTLCRRFLRTLDALSEGIFGEPQVATIRSLLTLDALSESVPFKPLLASLGSLPLTLEPPEQGIQLFVGHLAGTTTGEPVYVMK
jgi:hypothetical protein